MEVCAAQSTQTITDPPPNQSCSIIIIFYYIVNTLEILVHPSSKVYCHLDLFSCKQDYNIASPQADFHSLD